MKLIYKPTAPNRFKRVRNYLGTLNNTPQALEMVRLLKRVMRPWGHIYIHGRNPNRKQFYTKRALREIAQGRYRWCGTETYALQSDISIARSTHFDVYLRVRPEFERWSEAQADYIWTNAVPSLWKLSLAQLRRMARA